MSGELDRRQQQSKFFGKFKSKARLKTTKNMKFIFMSGELDRRQQQQPGAEEIFWTNLVKSWSQKKKKKKIIY